MQKTAQQIFDECGSTAGLVALHGSATVSIQSIAPYESGTKGAMVFAPNKKAIAKAIDTDASLIVLPQKLLPKEGIPNRTIITSNNIGLSHALLKQRYGDHDYRQAGVEQIHPTASIHESVQLPKTISIGPNVVIEKGVQLGENCKLMANVVLEHGATIGEQVTIHPGTIIGWDCVIGDHCLILSNTVIGGEGFGYAQDESFHHHRIPQTGNVVIGKRVTIGALNSIESREPTGTTTIGDGCIFDNQCHVAHNVTIGAHCILLSGFLCAGSSVLGNRVVASGGTMIKDHVQISDNTYLVHRAGVIKDIQTPGMYAGSPVLPMKEYVKSNAVYAQLGTLRKMVLELNKKVAELSQ